jgi:hypothetical protein
LRDKWIKGLDIAISTMAIGEISRFILKPNYGYGIEGTLSCHLFSSLLMYCTESRAHAFIPHYTAGYPPKVLPNVSLDYEVELLSFGDSLPKFPSQEELAVSRKEREEEVCLTVTAKSGRWP